MRSFTDVLPTDPVMPTTSAPRRRRARRPRSSSAAAVSATAIAGDAVGGTRCVGERRGRAGGEGGGDEVVAVALGDDRHEQLARPHGRGVDGDAVDLDVGAVQRRRRSPPRCRWPGSRTDACLRLAPVARPDRIRLVVLFGGQSAEHEVSCTSALPRAAGRRPRPLRRRAGRHHPRRAGGCRPATPSPPSRRAPLRRCPRPTARRRTAEVEPLPAVLPATTASRSSCCRCSTARWARTAPCRGCSSSPASPTSAPASPRRRCAWTRGWPRRCSPPPASRSAGAWSGPAAATPALDAVRGRASGARCS